MHLLGIKHGVEEVIAPMGLQSTGEKDKHLTITRQTKDACHPQDTSTVRMRLISKGRAGKMSTRVPRQLG